MKKIFIADDNQNLLSYLEKSLREAGHEVVTEPTGLSAINRLVEYTPDIIFLDYFLPNLNADKLCQIIRKMDHLKNTYLVVMSAAAKELQLDPHSIGANALIAKETFKTTTKYIFSAIEDAREPSGDKQRSEILGGSTVQSRQMTLELLEKNHHLLTILDSISEGIVEIYRGQIVYANPAAVTILDRQRDQLLAARLPDLFDEPERVMVECLMGSEQADSATINWKGSRQSEDRIVSLKKLPLQGDADTIILLMVDITERVRNEEALRGYQHHLEALIEERTADLKRTSERLLQAQKMEAVGIITSGVAHDLNNILTGIVAYPDLLLMEIPDDSPLKKLVLSIQESGQRAAAVVQDLLTMARRGVSINEVVNMNTVVTEYLNSPECDKLKSFHPKIDIGIKLEDGLFNILGSPFHLSKTIMNIVSNAAESMPDGGKILISTENRYVNRKIRIRSGNEEIKEGDYVTLTVSDSGVGITPENIEKIFDPFYTKKVMGRSGTGLGMTVVWGTVRDHKGYIDIQSTVGKGTALILYFPVTRQDLTKKRSSIPIEQYKGRGESILVVDDAEEQRRMVSMALTTLGYSTSTASSGEEAVEFLKTNQVDLIILDMIMDPGIDGLETYRQILKFRPKQKAIIASGYSEKEQVEKTLELGVGQYINKPYTLMKLGMAVRQELDKK